MANLKDVFVNMLEKPSRQISPSQSIFTYSDFLLLCKVINGDDGGFIIFNNAGGKPFDIWEVNPDEVMLYVDKIGLSYIYGYRINNEDTIIKPIY